MLDLKNIDFKVNKGEFVCVIGDVGSGKSSLLSAINGEMLYVPDDLQLEASKLVNASNLQKIFDQVASSELKEPAVWMQGT